MVIGRSRKLPNIDNKKTSYDNITQTYVCLVSDDFSPPFYP